MNWRSCAWYAVRAAYRTPRAVLIGPQATALRGRYQACQAMLQRVLDAFAAREGESPAAEMARLLRELEQKRYAAIAVAGRRSAAPR